MALEFLVHEVQPGNEGRHAIYIDGSIQGVDPEIGFTYMAGGKQHDFDVLGLPEIYELGVYLNAKLGFDLVNLYAVKKQIETLEKSKNGTV